MTNREDVTHREMLRKQQFEDDFKELMSKPSGRRLMFWLLETTGVFRTTFVETQLNQHHLALSMAHAEGKKDIGYRLMARIGEFCPDQYTLMMKENKNG